MIKKKNLLFIYFFYRIGVMLFALLVVGENTQLGDTGRYLGKNFLEIISQMGIQAFLTRNEIVDVFVSFVKFLLLGNDLLTNIFFNCLAFLGVKNIIDAVRITDKNRFKLLSVLIFFPSFNIWSSVAGKEAIIVFMMGIITARLIRYFYGEKFKLDLPVFISLFFIFVIKSQYAAAIVELLLYIKISEKFKLNGYLELLVILFVVAANIMLLYIFRDYIDAYSKYIYYAFRPDARSTRELPFIHKYDFFRIMPYGYFISFWGPTLEETKISFLHLFSFIESFVLFVFLFALTIKVIYVWLIKMKFEIRKLFLIFNTLFWFLFAQYMQGILNPGSAIRYRTNLYMMVVILFFFIYTHPGDTKEGQKNLETSLNMEHVKSQHKKITRKRWKWLMS